MLKIYVKIQHHKSVKVVCLLIKWEGVTFIYLEEKTPI